MDSEQAEPTAQIHALVTPQFRVGDRVRIKFGADRGHYGTVTSSGGDDGTYYGVKLDCHPVEMGYSEYELAAA